MKEKVLIIYLVFVAILSLITFILYGVDKKKAKKGEWRIPEKTLLLCSFFGGAVGGVFAMLKFRHKTKHAYFYIVNFLGLALIITVIYLILFIIRY